MNLNVGKHISAYFSTEIKAEKLYCFHAGNAQATAKKLKEHDVNYSTRSLYRIKKNKTKTFSVNNKSITITKI